MGFRVAGQGIYAPANISASDACAPTLGMSILQISQISLKADGQPVPVHPSYTPLRRTRTYERYSSHKFALLSVGIFSTSRPIYRTNVILQLTLIDCSANDRSLHYTKLRNTLLQPRVLASRITWPRLVPLALV
jgi:hypothetical protein